MRKLFEELLKNADFNEDDWFVCVLNELPEQSYARGYFSRLSSEWNNQCRKYDSEFIEYCLEHCNYCKW